MDYLNNLLATGHMPIVAAFLLGLLTAISPCPLATNITAIGYISKGIGNKHKVFVDGLLYTLGRIIAYSVLGFILIPLLRESASVFNIQKSLTNYGSLVIGPLLIIVGIFMLVGHKLPLNKWGFSGQGSEKLKSWGAMGAFLLGVLFAMAFCPTSGVFYFGMLMPLAVTSHVGYLLPAIYALATGLPVLVVAWILAYSVQEIGRFYNRMQQLQKWFNKLVAIVFIAIGLYYVILIYF